MPSCKRKPRLDDAKLAPLLTPEILRAEFIADCSRPANRALIVGKRQAPLQVLRSRKASWRDKLDAWSKIVNRLGLTEKQQVELSGAVTLTCADVYVHPAEDRT